MPKYTFKCECGNVKQYITSSEMKTCKCRECGSEMNRQLPTLNGSVEVKELIDKYTNTSWKEDQTKLLEDRKKTYFWEVEVPRMVNSGVYSLETMLENGWVYYSPKGELLTRTKPPQKE